MVLIVLLYVGMSLTAILSEKKRNEI
jgi:hypothetical protein